MENGEPALQASLVRLGAKRVEAALLAVLLEDAPLATRDIVDRTGLRQPEVSVGMRALRERGWVGAEPLPRHGKGRPMHQYRLTAEPEAIRHHYEKRAQRAIERYERALQELRRHT